MAAAARRVLIALSAMLRLSLAVAAGAAAGASIDQLPQNWREDDGRALELRSLTGRRIVLTMAYTGCHAICPITIDHMKSMQRELDARGEAAEFVVVGYDPEGDRPGDWHAFRVSHHLERSNWHFLSGSRDDTEQLARRLGFDFWKYDEHVMHGLRALVFDARGHLQLQLGSETKDWAARL